MAIPFDAAARLAEGRPAVDDLTEYVLACRRLGYQNPDLTARASQVRDWYDGEAGLDLRALDADCAALAGAAGAAEDAARTHSGLAAEVGDAWSGRGAAAAREFASRSGQAATSVSSLLRVAADALTTLRDELWRTVDAKVATVRAIDGRHAAERAEWLAAASTVTTGAGDLATASELVDQHVKPFVQNDVGSDFVGAMRTAVASIGAAYDAAIASTSSGAPAVFDVPGDLGPRTMTAERPGSDDGAVPVAIATPPAAGIPLSTATFSPIAAPLSGPAWSASPAGPPPVVDPASSAPLPPTAPAASSMPSTPSMGDLGGGPTGLGGAPSGLGGAMSGFGQQLADLIGSLVGSSGGTEDLAGIDDTVDDPGDPLLDDPEADEDPNGEDPNGEDPNGEDPDDADPDDDPALDDEPEAEAGEEPTEAEIDAAPAEPVPEPTPVPSPPPQDGEPVGPPAVLEGVAEPAAQTPCEIAADELPQVGE